MSLVSSVQTRSDQVESLVAGKDAEVPNAEVVPRGYKSRHSEAGAAADTALEREARRIRLVWRLASEEASDADS